MPPTQATQLGFFTFTGAQAGKGCGWDAFGNNDGIVNVFDEVFPFWSHLSDAKLIKGSYGGTAGNLLISAATICTSGAGNPAVYPTNHAEYEKFMPHSKILSSTGFIRVFGNYLYSPNKSGVVYSGIKQNNMLNMFDPYAATGIVTANELYQIDSKIDGTVANNNLC